MYRIILIGAPGVGKGTQGRIISEHFKIPQISVGDILRAGGKKSPELEAALEYVNKGALVPDEIIMGVIKNRLLDDDCVNGYILDGFPRTLVQAEQFSNTGVHIDKVIVLTAPYEEIVQRISGRRMCSNSSCASTYHLSFNKPKIDGKCDECGMDLTIRKDDTPETVQKRLDTYEKQSKPVVDFYRKLGKLAEINALGSFEKVFSDIVAALES